MSYATGGATDPIDLLNKLVTFLGLNGWTLDNSQADGAGAWRAHMHRSGIYVNLKATIGAVQPWGFGGPLPSVTIGGVHLYLSTAFAGTGVNWNLQTGAPSPAGNSGVTVGTSMQLLPGAIAAYHFFSNDGGDNISVVVERVTGVFHHLGWGVSLSKSGTWTGGQYFFGSLGSNFWASLDPTLAGTILTSWCPGADTDGSGACAFFVRADVDSFTGKWVSMSQALSPSYGYDGKPGSSGIRGRNLPLDVMPHYSSFEARTYASMTQTAILLPVQAWVLRDAGGYSLLGTVPRIFRTAATQYGLAAGAEFSLGADTYKLFHNFAVLKT